MVKTIKISTKHSRTSIVVISVKFNMITRTLNNNINMTIIKIVKDIHMITNTKIKLKRDHISTNHMIALRKKIIKD